MDTCIRAIFWNSVSYNLILIYLVFPSWFPFIEKTHAEFFNFKMQLLTNFKSQRKHSSYLFFKPSIFHVWLSMVRWVYWDNGLRLKSHFNTKISTQTCTIHRGMQFTTQISPLLNLIVFPQCGEQSCNFLKQMMFLNLDLTLIKSTFEQPTPFTCFSG